MDQPQYKRELNLCIDLSAWLGYDPVFLNKLISGILNNNSPEILSEPVLAGQVASS
jgi:hypothetical protein